MDHPVFKLGQPIDDILYIMRRTRRQRLAVEFTGKEGTFLFDLRRRKRRRDVEKELLDASIDLNQNFTVRYFLLDCTLSFKKYTGLDNKGARCYRIVAVDEPIDVDTLSDLT